MRYSCDLEALESQIFDAGEDGEETQAQLPEEESPWQEDIQEPVMMAITLEDGTELECRVEGVFLEGGKEYIALETDQGEIQIMELGQGDEDEILLIPVAGEEEQAQVVQAFIRLFGDEADGHELPEEDSPGETEAEDPRVRAWNTEKTERGNEDDRD